MNNLLFFTKKPIKTFKINALWAMVNAEGTHSIYFLNSYFILSPYTKAVTQSDGKIELNKIKNN
jgi:hypothetical protein